VGSNLAILFKRNNPSLSIVALDNLKRRGSELSLRRLQEVGVEFVHGDVRLKSDFEEAGGFDLLIDCSAEPSVLAGTNGSPAYVIDTNLTGTLNCLEACRTQGASFIFLSTSRVYPIAPLMKLNYTEGETRFNLSSNQTIRGASEHGVSEDFVLDGARSLYGASKLASELFVSEYLESYGLKGVVNRCGVLTGPWQMGKVDQGVIALWIAKHVYEKQLSYIGFGGTGKQVRDIMHVEDLFDLIVLQLAQLDGCSGETFNVGGGSEVSVSLRELTEQCQRATGKRIPIKQVPENRPNDIPVYLSDCRKVMSRFAWKPQRSVEMIVDEMAKWIVDNREALAPVLS
jgi:CDP-paratose 2-epimerase